jgi:hypothetical protein
MIDLQAGKAATGKVEYCRENGNESKVFLWTHCLFVIWMFTLSFKANRHYEASIYKGLVLNQPLKQVSVIGIIVKVHLSLKLFDQGGFSPGCIAQSELQKSSSPLLYTILFPD